MDGPLNFRVVGVLDRDGLDFEAGMRVVPRERPLRALRVKSFAAHFGIAASENIRRVQLTELEAEGQFGDVTAESLCRPSSGDADFRLGHKSIRAAQ
jgi:hypothetical protein